jgi:hypothetical protein
MKTIICSTATVKPPKLVIKVVITITIGLAMSQA